MSLDKPLSRYSGPTISIYIHMRKRRVKHRSVEDQGLGPQLVRCMYPTLTVKLISSLKNSSLFKPSQFDA